MDESKERIMQEQSSDLNSIELINSHKNEYNNKKLAQAAAQAGVLSPS